MISADYLTYFDVVWNGGPLLPPRGTRSVQQMDDQIGYGDGLYYVGRPSAKDRERRRKRKIVLLDALLRKAQP